MMGGPVETCNPWEIQPETYWIYYPTMQPFLNAGGNWEFTTDIAETIDPLTGQSNGTFNPVQMAISPSDIATGNITIYGQYTFSEVTPPPVDPPATSELLTVAMFSQLVTSISTAFGVGVVVGVSLMVMFLIAGSIPAIVKKFMKF